MKVSEFTLDVTRQEGKKVNLSIAQIKEVLRVTNMLMEGELYRWIRHAKRE